MKYRIYWMLLGSILFFSTLQLEAAPLTPPKQEQGKEQNVRKKSALKWAWKPKKLKAPKEDKKPFPWLAASSMFFGVLWIAFMALQLNLFTFYWGFALLAAVSAIVFGIFALKKGEVKKLAIAGIVLGVIGLLGGLMYLFTAVLMI
jgi:hypothetical protein